MQRTNGPRNRRGGRDTRRRDRNDYPRDGVRKVLYFPSTA